MSADVWPAPGDAVAAVQLMEVPDAAGRAEVCSGCGQRPQVLPGLDALAVIAFIERRFASLLRNPEHSLRDRGPGRGSWSAMEPAMQVSETLGAANRRLRDLLCEDALQPGPAVMIVSRSATGPPLSAVRASLTQNASRLVATIKGASGEDWCRARPDNATAAEHVWLALHDATHHLEDAELLLDSASTRRADDQS